MGVTMATSARDKRLSYSSSRIGWVRHVPEDNGAPGAPWGYMENALERDGVAALERQLRLQADLIDSLDEELELELDDRRLDGEDTSDEDWRANRQRYFRELLRLQGELVKLQDWVVHSGHRLVVLFEGRDAAGKAASSSASRSA